MLESIKLISFHHPCRSGRPRGATPAPSTGGGRFDQSGGELWQPSRNCSSQSKFLKMRNVEAVVLFEKKIFTVLILNYFLKLFLGFDCYFLAKATTAPTSTSSWQRPSQTDATRTTSPTTTTMSCDVDDHHFDDDDDVERDRSLPSLVEAAARKRPPSPSVDDSFAVRDPRRRRHRPHRYDCHCRAVFLGFVDVLGFSCWRTNSCRRVTRRAASRRRRPRPPPPPASTPRYFFIYLIFLQKKNLQV